MVGLDVITHQSRTPGPAGQANATRLSGLGLARGIVNFNPGEPGTGWERLIGCFPPMWAAQSVCISKFIFFSFEGKGIRPNMPAGIGEPAKFEVAVVGVGFC